MKGQRNIFKRFAGRMNPKSRLEQPAAKPVDEPRQKAPEHKPKPRKRKAAVKPKKPAIVRSQKGITGKVEAKHRHRRKDRHLAARGRVHRAQDARRRDDDGKVIATRIEHKKSREGRVD